NALFGGSVGTAGDVNGDGYADVIVGATYFDNGQTDEGRAFVYHGGAAGLSVAPAWTAESDQADAYFGGSVGTAGDVNGDGYADVVVGATYFDNGQTDEGRAFVYYGNGGAGLTVRPQPRRADDSAPVAPGGQVISPSEARLAALLRTPFGRSDVALEWEIKPEGTAFTGTGLSQSAWTDSGTAGASISQLVSGLAFETRYRWRVRILGRPRAAATNSAVTYRSRWLNGATFLTALSGQQAIAGSGSTNLLNQAANVDVSSVGSPPLSSLTLRGYPNTLPPNASSMPGYGSGTVVLDRYFWLEPNGGAAGYALTLCLSYDDSEVAAAGASEAALQLCRWTGSAWQCQARASGSNTSANLVCADEVTAFSNWAIASGSPLAVTLAGFTAEAQAGQVLVTWETVSELNNAGFNLYRGLLDDGSDRALLVSVPSQAPGSAQGYAYNYVDATVDPGQTYWYWLEDIDLSGATTRHGPVSVTVNAPTAVTLRGLQAGAATSTATPTTGALTALLALLAAAAVLRLRRIS
ncbi:MAG TPA: integrin alpha, partial [Anaerolineae bacterium]|nr:integrin alpha [Anaerolineae bacterium]